MNFNRYLIVFLVMLLVEIIVSSVLQFTTGIDRPNLGKDFGCGVSITLSIFDKFLLAAESRDLSQADKSMIRVSSFPKLSDG